MNMLIELLSANLSKAKTFLFPVKENRYRARIFAGNFLVYFLAAIILLKAASAVFLAYFPRNDFFADITKTALVQMANADRQNFGLPALKENPVLERAAYLKAQDMLKNGYFSHMSPAGVTPWYWFSLSGYNYRYAGENLAIGFLDSSEVNEAWLDSPSHKANILNNKYKEIGIAVATGNFQGAETTIVVQLFGAKQPVLGAKTSPGTAAPASPAQTAKKDVQANLPSYEKVLGAAADKSGAKFDFFSFMTNDFFLLVRNAIYAAVIFVILLLAANFLLKFDLAHKDLFFKAVFFVAVLLFAAAIDKGVILQLLPHEFGIF